MDGKGGGNAELLSTKITATFYSSIPGKLPGTRIRPGAAHANIFGGEHEVSPKLLLL